MYTNGFENCGVSLGDLSESDLARTLDDKIARPTAKGRPLTVEITDLGSGRLLTVLPLGLYLVVQTTAAAGE